MSVSPKDADAGSKGARALRLSRERRLLLGILGLIALAAAAVYQPLPPDPLVERSFPSRDWWFYPVERNAIFRLPSLGGTDILGGCAVHGTETVWLVGDKGLLVRSDDGGVTWNRVELRPATTAPTSAPNAVETPPATTASVWSMFPESHAAERPDPRQQEQNNASPSFQSPDPKQQASPDDAQGQPQEKAPASTVPSPPPLPRPWSQHTFTSVSFIDANHGWLLAHDLLLATEDGGQTWRAMPVPPGGLSMLRAASRSDLWVVGGANLHHWSGGRWRATRLLEEITDIAFDESGKPAWATSEDGLWQTIDGGESWQQWPDVDVPHDALASRSATDVWAVGGNVMRWDGLRWSEVLAPETGRRWVAVETSFDGRGIWLVDLHGAVRVSSDGGSTWRDAPRSTVEAFPPLSSPILVPLRDRALVAWQAGSVASIDLRGDALRVTSGATGVFQSLRHTTDDQWIVSSYHDGLVSADDGRSWKVAPVPGPVLFKDPLPGVPHVDGGPRVLGRQGSNVTLLRLDDRTISEVPFDVLGLARGGPGVLVATAPGAIHRSQDDGRTWTRVWSDLGFTGPAARLDLLSFDARGTIGWAVGEWIALRTEDGGLHWGPVTIPAQVVTLDVSENGRYVLAGALDGSLLSWTGERWQLARTRAPGPITAVGVTDNGRGVACGPAATLLTTSDGGTTWEEPQPRRYPAPWIWVTGLLLLVFIVVPAFEPDPDPPPVATSVADELATDRPLRSTDADTLGFAPIGEGVARFLANEKTQAPLTIAVTGEWGTGKTSILQRMRDELDAYGFVTAWFNVWHHQDEDNVVAAMMESIESAMPSWWMPEGLLFRLRLLARRGLKHMIPAAILLLVLMAGVSFFVQNPTRIREAFGAVASLSKLSAPQDAKQGSSFFALVLTVVTSIIALRRGASTFTPRLKQWTSGIAGAMRIGEPSVDPAFKQRFARGFEDVVQALGHRRLVVFIDDLDRCQPRNTVRALETINFLASSADCFLVMAMAREWVVDAVGLGFKEIAEEIAAGVEGDARKKRRDFANQYLEKLVNIEVPVPLATREGLAALLARAPVTEETAAVPPATGKRWWAWTKRTGLATWSRFVVRPVHSYGVLAAIVGVVLMGVLLGPPTIEWGLEQVHGMQVEAVSAEKGTADVVPTVQTSALPSVAAPAPAPAPGDDPRVSRIPVVVVGGRGREAALWPWILGIVFVGGAAAVRLSMAPRPREADSDDFRAALKLWSPLIYRTTRTPRATKRFLNRVRYYAMCQRRPGGTPQMIPEPALVALASLHHAQPDWITQDSFWANLGDFLRREIPEQKERDSLGLTKDVLEGLPKVEPYKDLFRSMVAGVTIRR